jgi:hypothetical protein
MCLEACIWCRPSCRFISAHWLPFDESLHRDAVFCGTNTLACVSTPLQVEEQTLGEIAAGAPQGSVLLYGRELLRQGLPCLLQPRLLESWGNGTNTEVGLHTMNDMSGCRSAVLTS